MPTINFSLKDLQKLVGKKLTIEEVSMLCHYGKGDFKGYDKKTDEASVDFGDTNLPYLWSVEGFARLIRGILGLEKGIPELKIQKADYKIIVDKSVSGIRPYIAGFVAKGCKVDDYLIKQIIQLQEKLCENYGRRRLKIAIGVYSYKKINFPVYYKATEPESIKFIPLDFRKEMTQQEILEEHPKGKEYAWILKDCKKYPILVDSKEQVLSFPPIINSAITGKVEEGEEDLLFEVTGTELEPILLAANIFAYALYERGFKIYSVEVNYHNKKIITPVISAEKIKITKQQIRDLVGLDLNDAELKKLLEKIQYNYNKGVVDVPCYRKDILHPVDVIEDIAIAYGYDKIKEMPLVRYTIGSTSGLQDFIDICRDISIGLGYQEVFSPVLNCKININEKMNIPDFGTIEISNKMSDTYSAVRSWLIPVLIECLSKNKHVEYPQKIFEQGIVTVRKNNEINDYERIAFASAHEKADFTEIKQALDYFMRILGLKYEIEEVEHSSFIEGRVGRVIVNGKKVGFIGEINPKVLDNWGIEAPVCAMEINLTELFQLIKK